MRVGVYGLGEAGSLFAADLAAVGVHVNGYDPAPVATPPRVQRFSEPGPAVDDVDLIITLVAAADAPVALAQSFGTVRPGTVYADVGTGSPGLKRELAADAAAHGLVFVDVALLAIVIGKGLRTPAQASGPGAARYVEMLAPLGVPVEAIGDEPGLAATRKLLRSVWMKGAAALLIEAMDACRAAGQDEWLWRNLVDELTAADETWMTRLIDGTSHHARRRHHEMQASAQLLEELDVDPLMTRSTVESLRRSL